MGEDDVRLVSNDLERRVRRGRDVEASKTAMLPA